MRTSALRLALALALAVPSTLSFAAEKPRPANPATPAATPAIPATPAAGVLEEPGELKSLKYRLLGPGWGGRVARVAGVAGNPSIYYAASASGGVWKSTDGGHSFHPIFDDQPISSIGSIAVAASDPNVVYVGSGEANIRGNVGAGNGIYKSIDGGKTWNHVWTQEGQIGTMAVDPRNADVAFAAVLGHAFGPNPERGVYRTKDGGRTWQQVLKKDAVTGASDVALDPANPNIVFAGLWQARRRPWEMTSGGPGGGLYVSRDGGDTWKQLTGKGLPGGEWGKVGIAVAPSDGRRVYALIENADGGLFRSDDGGDSWERISADRALRQRAWYYTTLSVSPANPDEVWCPQVPMLRSIDGGKTFQVVRGSHHGDNHDVWIDPRNARRLIVANDGGVDISENGGESWLTPPLPLGQFYHVSADNSVPFKVAGALQDIGTAQAPSNSLAGVGIRDTDWYNVGGGEAGHVVSDPADPAIVYAGEYGGIITRHDSRTGNDRNVSVYPDNPSGHGGEDLRYRFQWTAPIALSPHDPKAVYHAANVLFRSVDGGQSWTALSPDLTRNDKAKQKWSGGPITGDNTGVEIYATIFAVAESPVAKGVIWTGSDDGLVQVTRDDGKSWKDVTKAMPGFPEWGTVSIIEPGHFDAGTAYVAVDAHRMDDMRPYLYKTADFGATWKRLDGKLPKDVYLHSVREDPSRKGVLYLGTERGVAYSLDDGATWRALKLNLPTVAVHDLVVKDASLVLATHGRAMWILDDRRPLLDLKAETMAQENALFAASPAVRWTYRSAHRAQWSADNPPLGARLYYWLKSEVKGPEAEVKIDILDAKGTLVNTLSSKPHEATGASEYAEFEVEGWKKQALGKDAGLQVATWDFTWAGAETIPGGRLDAGYPAVGPAALPGTYTARLTVHTDAKTTAKSEAKTATATFEVQPDPRSRVPAADLEAQLKFCLEIRDAITGVTRAVEQVRTIRRQLQARNDLLKGVAAAESLRKASTDLTAKLDALEAKLHNPKAEVVYDILAQQGGTKLYSRLSFLFDIAQNGDGAPTQGAREEFARQRVELDAGQGELNHLVTADLAALNATATQLGLPLIYVPASR